MRSQSITFCVLSYLKAMTDAYLIFCLIDSFQSLTMIGQAQPLQDALRPQ